MKPDQARKPFRTLGMRMQSFSQSLMRSYAPAPQQASPSENSSKITPVWQSVSEIPLLWPDDAVSAPSQAAFGDEGVNAAAETPSESMSGMYRPTSPRPPRNPMTPAAPPRTAEEAIQRATAPVPSPTPARSSAPATPPLPRTAEEAIQRAMAPASSRPAEGGKNRIPSDLLNLLALHQEADRKREQIREEKKSIYNESGAPIQRKRGSASFDYVETSALRQPGDGEPEAPATGQAEEARASQSTSEDGEADGDDSTLAPAGAGPPVNDAPVSSATPDSSTTITRSEVPAVMQRQVEADAPPAAPPLDAADSVDDAPAMQAVADETSVVMDAPEGSAATTPPTVQRQIEMAVDAQTSPAPALPHEATPTQAMDAPVSEPRAMTPEAKVETARDTGAAVSRASEVIQRAEAMPEAVTDAPATPIQEDGEAPDYAAAPEMVSRATTDTSDSPARTVTRSDDAEAVTQQATAMPDNTAPERAQRQVETHGVDVTAVPATAAVHSPVEMATGDVSAAIEAAEQGESPAVDRPVNDVPAVVQRARVEAMTPNAVSETTPAAAPMDVAQRNAAPEADEISAPETAATVGGWHEPTVSETMPRMSDAPVIQREMVDVSAAERGESPADRPANDVPAPVQRAQAEAVMPNAVSEPTPMDVAADEMNAPETAATVGGWHEPTVSMSDAPVIQRETGDVSATIEAADRPANDVPAAVQRTRAEAATPNAVSEATPTAVPMDVAQENAAPETAATVGGWHEPAVSETTPRMSDAPVIQRETGDVSAAIEAVEGDESPADRLANDVPAAAVQRAQLEAVTPNAVSEATPTAAPMDVVPEAVAADEMSAPEATATVGGWHEPTVSETTPSMSDAAAIQRETVDVSAAIEAAEQQDIPSGEPVAMVQMARAANVHETEDVSAAIEAAEPVENPTAVTADQAAMTEAEAPFTPRQPADAAQRHVVEADRPTAETEATRDAWQTTAADVSAPDYFDEQPIQRAAPAEDAVVMGDEAAAHETRTLETPSAPVMRQVETAERAAPVMEQETANVPGDEAASVLTQNIQREAESADSSPAQGEVMEADEAGYENLQAVDLLEALNASGYLPAEPDRVARQAAPEMPRGIESVSDKPRLDEELMRLLQSAPPPPAPPVPSPTSSAPQTIQRTSVPEMNRVQRVEGETENVSADVNIDQLARDVYSLLRQRLRIERERQDRL